MFLIRCVKDENTKDLPAIAAVKDQTPLAQIAWDSGNFLFDISLVFFLIESYLQYYRIFGIFPRIFINQKVHENLGINRWIFLLYRNLKMLVLRKCPPKFCNKFRIFIKHHKFCSNLTKKKSHYKKNGQFLDIFN
jgi:hypothetical protein